jgi:phage gpG-like protein
MPVTLEIDVKTEGARSALAEAAARMADMTPVFKVVGELLKTSVERNFEVGGRPRWKGLSAITKGIRKKKNKWPGQILAVTGMLKNSIHPSAFPDHVEIGTPMKYAATQQFGAARGAFGAVVANVRAHVRRMESKNKRGKSSGVAFVKAHQRKQAVPWGTIPPRPFLMVQDEDWEDIRDAIGAFITGQ